MTSTVLQRICLFEGEAFPMLAETWHHAKFLIPSFRSVWHDGSWIPGTVSKEKGCIFYVQAGKLASTRKYQVLAQSTSSITKLVNLLDIRQSSQKSCNNLFPDA